MIDPEFTIKLSQIKSMIDRCVKALSHVNQVNIDCRREDCSYQDVGHCHHPCPQITLNEKVNGNKTYVCWSHSEMEEEND